MEIRLQYIVYGLLLASLCLPLLADIGWLMFPLGREMIFRLLVGMILAVYIGLVIIRPEFRPKLTPLTLAVLGFWLVSGLATIFSLQPSFSFWGNVFRGQGFLCQTHLTIFFLILTAVIKKEKQWLGLLILAAGVGTSIGLLGIGQAVAGSDFRVASTLNNPVFLAGFLLLTFFLTLNLYFLLKKEKAFFKLGLVLAGVIQLLALAATVTRSAYLAGGAGLAVFILTYCFSRLSGRKLKIKIAIGLVGLFAIGAGLVVWSIVQVSTRESSWGRLDPWRAGVYIIKDRPLLGVGSENFIIAADKYYQGGLENTGYPWFDKAHNVIIETLATRGVLGLLSYLSIWLIILWSLYKLYRQKTILNWGLTATFLAFGVYLLFAFNTVSSNIYFYAWLALLNFLVFSPQSENETAVKADVYKKFTAGLAIVILLAVTVVIGQTIYAKTLTANYLLNAADSALAHGEIDKAFLFFKTSLDQGSRELEPYTRYHWGEAAVDLLEQASWQGQAIDNKIVESVLAEQILNQGNDFKYFSRSYAVAGGLAGYLNRPSLEIDSYWQKAIELSPNRPSFHLAWARCLSRQGQIEKAQEKISQAEKINSDNFHLWWLKGVVSLYQGQTEQGLEQFARAKTLGLEINWQKLNDLLIYFKDQEKVINFLRNNGLF